MDTSKECLSKRKKKLLSFCEYLLTFWAGKCPNDIPKTDEWAMDYDFRFTRL